LDQVLKRLRPASGPSSSCYWQRWSRTKQRSWALIGADGPNKNGLWVTRSTNLAQREEKATQEEQGKKVRKVRKVRNQQKQLNQLVIHL
jgi:hypothetical protein